MMGQHNSVASKFLGIIPNLFVLKCICHSFHLCASYACTKLPNKVELLTREIYNYFSNSPKRVAELKLFQQFANVKLHKILHPCQTRWMSLNNVITRILEQYNALILFFTDAAFKKDPQAEIILSSLKDPTNKLYLQFLEYILPFFVNLNICMQSESPQISKLYNNVKHVVKTILDCYIKRNVIDNVPICDIDYCNPRNMLPLENMYFGAAIASAEIDRSILHGLKLKCLDFYIESIKQITSRFPLKNNIIQEFQFINPVAVKEKTILSIAQVGSKLNILINKNDLQNLDNEWRLLRNSEMPKTNDVVDFWSEIMNTELGNGSLMYPYLSKFVLNILTFPHSSANVERIFSTINILKTKQRNKLNTKTVEAILHSKRLIQNNGECYNFKIDNNLRKLFTNDIYDKDSEFESDN